VAATLRVQVGTVRRDLDRVAVHLRPDGPEALADGPEVVCVRPQELLDLARVRVGRRVRVRVLAPEQRVPHVPAHQVQLVPRLPKTLAQARERLGHVQLFDICHHE
jgi:hypothetical protein